MSAFHIAPFSSFVHCLLGFVELEAMASTPSPPRELILGVLSPRPLAMVPLEIIIVSSDDEDSSGRPKKERKKALTADNRRPLTQRVCHCIKIYASSQTA